MKRFLLWTFERASFQWDVMCGIILAFMFLVPRSAFDDRPEFLQLFPERVHKTVDRNGNTIHTVKLERPVFFDTDAARQAATKSLQEALGRPVRTDSRKYPIHDWKGHLVAYAVWIER